MKMRRKSPIHAMIKPPEQTELENNKELHDERCNHKYFGSVEYLERDIGYTDMEI